MTDQHYRIPPQRLSLPHRPLPFAAAISPPATGAALSECEHTSSSALATTMDTKRTQWKRQEGNGKNYVIIPKLRLPITFPELAARGKATDLTPVTTRHLMIHMDASLLPHPLQMASPEQKQTRISSSVLTVEFSLEEQKQKRSRQFLGKPDHLRGAWVVVKVMVAGTK
jgi:hypothetical protein